MRAMDQKHLRLGRGSNFGNTLVKNFPATGSFVLKDWAKGKNQEIIENCRIISSKNA